MTPDLALRPRLPRAIALTAAMTLGFVAFAWMQDEGTWAGFTPGDCPEYCEASDRCGPLAERPVVQQPLNAWSNLAFAFVGALALTRPLTVGGGLFAASALLLAAGSFLFHASVTLEMQWLDMVGTYAALVALLACAARRVWGVAWSLLLPAALLADAAIARFKWQLEATVVIPALVLAIAVPMTQAVRRGRGRASAALHPLFLFLAAWGIRELDVQHVACDPRGWYQGHALWHLLTAASLWASYRFLERAGPD